EDEELKYKILESIENLDDATDGVLINSDNFHGLNFLQNRYREKVKCAYIDPPYNTGSDGFAYKDNYQHSSWLSMMNDRLQLSKELLSENGALFSSIDDFESKNLIEVNNIVFGTHNFMCPLFIQVRYTNKTLSEDSDFQKVIEQVFIHTKSDKFKPIKESEEYSIDKFEWEITELEKGEKFEAGGKSIEVFTSEKYEIKKVAPHVKALKETWATGTLARQKGSSGEFFELHLGTRKDLDGLNCLYKVYGIGEDGLGFRYFTGPKKATATKGKFYSGIPLQTLNELNLGMATKDEPIPNFFDYSGEFGNCRLEGKVDIKGGKKPEKLIEKIINTSIIEAEKNYVLDYFAGSGTTPAVAHKMNKKYLAIEMGEYFESRVLKRMKYTLFGDSGGIESQNLGGIVKYYRLEQYEDTLENSKLQSSTDTDSYIKALEPL
ncbi:MAG: site-specific DNA-methyltransferase, partial [Campylobacterales bacterium]|nr:site-specific DNA-methyltransferase [Campylobacterales bacterium]